ncbi:unnamed protein product [Agarophyton chilense]
MARAKFDDFGAEAEALHHMLSAPRFVSASVDRARALSQTRMEDEDKMFRRCLLPLAVQPRTRPETNTAIIKRGPSPTLRLIKSRLLAVISAKRMFHTFVKPQSIFNGHPSKRVLEKPTEYNYKEEQSLLPGEKISFKRSSDSFLQTRT